MDVTEAIQTRRSVRSYTEQTIDDETLISLVQAGAAAPSGSNSQPWVFVVVRQPQRRKTLQSFAPGMSGTPQAVIALCLNHQRASTDCSSWLDMGAAMQNILLQAHHLGLGACPIASFHAQAIVTLLELPAHLHPVLLVALGYPQSVPQPPMQRPLDDTLFYEKCASKV